MYGWRARVGLIIPSLNVTIEPEFAWMAPEGVSFHTTRVLLERGTPDQLERMAGEAEGAARLLATAGVDLIVYACTSGSLIKGLGWDLEIIRSIESATGIPAFTTSTAVIEAFKFMEVSGVSVGTPYIDEVNRIEKEFFEAHGIKVPYIEGLGYTKGEQLHAEPPETAYRLGKKVNRPEADSVFLSCTDFKTIEIIAPLERDLGKPVMSSNTVTMWAVLRRLGIRDEIGDYGELLRRVPCHGT